MATATGSSAPAATPARMSSLARIVGTFASPGATFADIAREPHFILCLCVEVVAGLLYSWEILHRVGAYTLTQQAMGMSPMFRNLDPAVQQRQLAMAARVTPYTTYLQPIFGIIVYLILAAIFLGIANFVLGYEARYKQTLAMVSHAFLAMTLFFLLAALVVALMGDPSSFQMVNPIGTNVGFYLDKASTAPFLYALAGRLDIFALWTTVLLSLGLAKIGGKKGKFGSAFGTVVALWLLMILTVAGVTAAFA